MSEFNTIHDPETGERFSIFSSQGRNLLKMYLLTYKSGGTTGPFSMPTEQNTNSPFSVGQPQKTQTEGPFSLEPSRERAEQIKQNIQDWRLAKNIEEASEHHPEIAEKIAKRLALLQKANQSSSGRG